MIRKIELAISIVLAASLIILFADICSGHTAAPFPGYEPTGVRWKTIVLDSSDSIGLKCSIQCKHFMIKLYPAFFAKV
jgi:hypothetical protein